MTKNVILIDYEFCTGCHSCEMACQVEHDYPIGRTGILVQEVGPWEIEGDTWQFDYVPVTTDECDLCESRLEKGKAPTCVSHCQSSVMKFGPLEELVQEFGKKPKQVLYMPR